MLYFHFNTILFGVQDIQKAQDIQDMKKTKNEEEFQQFYHRILHQI